MQTRLKLTGPTITTRAQLDELIGEIRKRTLARNELILFRETAIKDLDDKIGPPLAEIEKQNLALTEQARAWAEANPEEFGKLKSLETTHGTLGWRTGNISLKTLAGWTWDRVIETIKRLPAMSGYLRLTEAVAKDVIISDREVLGPEGLRMLGVKVVQSETFFVEPKIE